MSNETSLIGNREFDRARLILMSYFCITSVGFGLPLLVTGDPGTAKTETMRRLAKRMRTPYLHLSPAQRGEGYFGVVPVPKELEDGTTILTMPSNVAIAEMVRLGHGLVVLDELRNCPRNLAAAMLGTLQEREFGDIQLPKGVRVIALSNEHRDSVNGQPLSAAAANRVCHVKWPKQAPIELLNFIQSGGLDNPHDREDPNEDYADHETVNSREAAMMELWPEYVKVAAAQVTRFLNATSSSKSKVGLNVKPTAGTAEADGPWQSTRSWTNMICTLASVRIMKRLNIIDDQAETDDQELAVLIDGLVGPNGTTVVTWVARQDLPDIVAVLDGTEKLNPSDPRPDRFALIVEAAAEKILMINISKDDADGKRKAMTDKRARWCKKFFEICNAVGSQQGYECVIGGIQRVVNNGAAIDVSSEAARKCIQAMSGRVTAAKMSG